MAGVAVPKASRFTSPSLRFAATKGVRSILSNLCAEDRTQAAVRALRSGLVEWCESRIYQFQFSRPALVLVLLPVCPAMSKAVPWSGDVRTKGKPIVVLIAWSKASNLTGIKP